MLTVRAVETAKVKAGQRERWLFDGGAARGAGRLALRVTDNGSRTWYFVGVKDGRRERIRIGPFASTTRSGDPPSGLTLEAAREEFRRLSGLRREHGTLRDYLHVQQQEKAAREQQEAHARAEAERRALDARNHTLRGLLDAYVRYLDQAGKVSAADVRRTFSAYVYPTPLADRPAREIEGREIAALLRSLAEQGKGRTAGKLRSFIASAYRLAARAESDPTAPAALLSFRIEADPTATVAAAGFARFNRTRDRVLSRAELRSYWKRIKALPGTSGDALRLHILLGGQRIAQLVRAEVSDYDADNKLLTLRDSKGRRTEPRQHGLPLFGQALTIVKRLADERGEARWRYLLANDAESHVRPETLDAAFREVLAAMKAANETDAEGFQLRDIRRTVETMLAANGISAEVRAHLQSHGLAGVQQRHYVKHDFLAEKRVALQRWWSLLGLRTAAAKSA